jgi:hypothetical protein
LLKKKYFMPHHGILAKKYIKWNIMKKELKMLLSTESRNKIKAQLREWIIENVNFE